MNEAEKITDLQEIRSRILALEVNGDLMLCAEDSDLVKAVRKMIYLDLHAIWPPQGRFSTRLLHDYRELKRELWITRDI